MTKARPKKPFIPAERYEPIRRLIISVLGGKTISAKEIWAKSASLKKMFTGILSISI